MIQSASLMVAFSDGPVAYVDLCPVDRCVASDASQAWSPLWADILSSEELEVDYGYILSCP